LLTEPEALKLKLCSIFPLEGPVGVSGVLTVSAGVVPPSMVYTKLSSDPAITSAEKFPLMSEMAVTDIEHSKVNKLKLSESAKFSDILAEQVSQFEDPDYWGDYNIIKPDESIEAAIDKLNRKLKRQL